MVNIGEPGNGKTMLLPQVVYCNRIQEDLCSYLSVNRDMVKLRYFHDLYFATVKWHCHHYRYNGAWLRFTAILCQERNTFSAPVNQGRRGENIHCVREL